MNVENIKQYMPWLIENSSEMTPQNEEESDSLSVNSLKDIVFEEMTRQKLPLKKSKKLFQLLADNLTED